MKKLTFVALVATLASLGAVPGRADADCPGGAAGIVPLTRNLGAVDARFCVVTPPGYDASGATTYPMLILLHGAGDTYKTWTHNTDVAALVTALHDQGRDVVVVMPDGGGTYGGQANSGWYSDWYDGSREWETFHLQEMLPYVEAAYHADASKLMIAGLSMGGYGAMKYAEDLPGAFKAAASFSGALDTMYGFPVDAVAFAALHSTFGTPDFSVWGPPTEVGSWRRNNPADPENIANLRGTPLWLASGEGLPVGAHDECSQSPPCAALLANPAALGGYGLELFIRQMNLSFTARLDALGIAHHDDFYAGGSHSWPYWQDELHAALPWMLTQVGA